MPARKGVLMIPAAAIVACIEALPTLPEAVARLTVLLQDERATTIDFEKAVHSDPAVTVNLLRAANSVHHGGLEPVTTVRQAVARIGLRRVYEVAIGTSFRRSLPLRLSGYGLDGPAFWLHCTATAVLAEGLGREIHLPAADIAFTAGLLHDVGKLVIGGFLAELMPESNWWTFGTATAERELLGSNHCDVGEEIALRWRLPLPIALACRWHHESETAGDGVDTDLAAVVHVADYLAYMAGFPGDAGVGKTLDPLVQQRLGLSLERLEQLAEASKEQVLQLSHVISTGPD
jgi:putative nucleotidyltransferase with HDIG domain